MPKNLPVKKPGKQRKLHYNAPQHLRQKKMAAPLSPELIASKSINSLPVRKGDTVQVTRGDHIGFEGKINRLDLNQYRIFIEGLTREKVDGTNIFVPIHPSKVMIKKLKLDDKWRKAIIERKKILSQAEAEKKVDKKTQKSLKASLDEKAEKNLKLNNSNKKVQKKKKDKIATNKEQDNSTIKKTSKKIKKSKVGK